MASLRISPFSTHTELSLPDVKLFWCQKPLSVRCSAGDSSSTSVAGGSDFDAKVFRHNLTRREIYNRKGFGHKKQTLDLMNQEYTSDIIKTLEENNNEYTWGNVTVKLAEAYGFCWGVERAVQIANEARNYGSQMKLFTTLLLIRHNIDCSASSLYRSFIFQSP